MSTLSNIPARIVHFRYARTVIDLLMLCGALALYMQTQSMVFEHKPVALKSISNAATSKQQTQSINQHHDTEIEMWAAWLNWLKTSQASGGYCQFDAGQHADAPGFNLHCISFSSTLNTQNLPTAETLFPKSVFDVLPLKASKTVKSSSNEHKLPSTPTLPVEGWIDTPNGRLYFDAKQQRWAKR